MRNSLRSLALVALAALPFAASATLNIKTVWVNGVENGVANNIPGLDAGWTKPTADGGTTTDTRFATGKDGKIFINNHKVNEIQSWDGYNFETVCKLPTVTSAVWNGTALSTDDAGNLIFNFGFTDKTVSLTNWAVLKNGVLTEVTLSTPLSDLNVNGRLDIISHIVGDVTSEKGGIGYSTIKDTDHLVMFHFKGDGTKVTSITAKASAAVPGISEYYGKQTETYQPSAKYTNIDVILASASPENEFYLPLGMVGNSTQTAYSFADGVLYNCANKIGNRGYGSVATVTLDGETYIIRNYVAEDNANAEILTNWKSIMQFGIFKTDGTCMATWTGSNYTSANGCETFSIEMVNDKTANIYVYTSTPSDDADSGTVKGCYAAMVTVSSEEFAAEPDGSEANPYLIATANDLCNAWKKTVSGKLVYFKQTADIDMAGVKDYTAFVGYNGDYTASIYYDGDYHTIYNFAPVDRIAGEGDKAYYDTSLFGTPSGTIKNLGVVNAKIETEWYEAGILGGFAGTGAQTATSELNIDNVFVTGTIKGGAKTIAGGMFGTSGQPLNITNSYVQIEINGQSYSAGFISKAATATKVSNSYASATVTGTTTALAVATDPEAPAAITFDNVVAFGTGAACNVATTGSATVVPALDATGIATVQGWEAFNQKQLFQGLPALNWQANGGAGFADAVVDNNDAPAVYYNLQGVQVANPDNGVYIVRRGNKVSKELIRK